MHRFGMAAAASAVACRLLKAPTAYSRASLRFQSTSSNDPSYYDVLGVSKQATQDEIKAAYKKLALEFHPDRNSAPGAEERFKKISEAYSVIGNREKRNQYDIAGVTQRMSWGPTQQQQQGFGYPFGGAGNTTVHFRQMTAEDAEKLFREIFGAGGIEDLFKGAFKEEQGQQFGTFQQQHVFKDASGNTTYVHRTSVWGPDPEQQQQQHKSFSETLGLKQQGQWQGQGGKGTPFWIQQHIQFRSPLLLFGITVVVVFATIMLFIKTMQFLLQHPLILAVVATLLFVRLR